MEALLRPFEAAHQVCREHMPVFLPHLPDGSVHHAVGFFGKIGSFQHILQLFLHTLILRAEEQQVPL